VDVVDWLPIFPEYCTKNTTSDSFLLFPTRLYLPKTWRNKFTSKADKVHVRDNCTCLILDFHCGINTDFWFLGFCTVCKESV
jgi:hypothetical protein